MVSAAARALPLDIVPERIETVIGDDRGKSEQFHVGSLRRVRGKISEARRFAFVRSVDALFAVGGGGGTAQELALGTELGIPILPTPLFSGATKDVWFAYRSELMKALGLDEPTAKRWETASEPVTTPSPCLMGSAPTFCTNLVSRTAAVGPL
jgi:hypothetical protein